MSIAKAEDVAKWSTKEWNKAKAQWAKEKEKWADCQKQSKDQKLSGRKSWSFLAMCTNPELACEVTLELPR